MPIWENRWVLVLSIINRKGHWWHCRTTLELDQCINLQSRIWAHNFLALRHNPTHWAMTDRILWLLTLSRILQSAEMEWRSPRSSTTWGYYKAIELLWRFQHLIPCHINWHYYIFHKSSKSPWARLKENSVFNTYTKYTHTHTHITIAVVVWKVNCLF